ncbi:MAG: hypothetical protein NC191_00450 [Muribaculaceae bacterium]|nr:hypothetical protein [Muribaculaceae bacterium]
MIWNLSDEYIQNEDWKNALKCCNTILYYEEVNIEAIKKSIICFKNLNDEKSLNKTTKHLEELEIQNDYECLKRAEFFNEQKNFTLAIKFLEKYIEMRNETAEPYYYSLLGCYYNSRYMSEGNMDDAYKAQEIFIKTAESAPNDHTHLKNVITMTFKTKDYELGKKYWEKIFALGELSERDKFDYSMFCLCDKNFEEHYKYWDARFTCDSVSFPKVNKPTWKGEDLSDKTLLVYYEMGYGDNILAWGYLPRVMKRAKRVVFAAFHQLYELFGNNPYGIEVVKAGEIDLNTFDYDYIIPCMSISAVLNVNLDNISVGEKSITVREDLVQEFKEKYFNNDKLKIGIAFKGNPIGSRSRDIEIKELLPLDNLKDVEIYSFTKDVPDEAFNCFNNHDIHNIVKDFENFEQTAAAIENCDVIITTDNCIMNLAGAVGKKLSDYSTMIFTTAG